jgi:ethanolamine ammonia-lyase large subunit
MVNGNNRRKQYVHRMRDLGGIRQHKYFHVVCRSTFVQAIIGFFSVTLLYKYRRLVIPGLFVGKIQSTAMRTICYTQESTAAE